MSVRMKSSFVPDFTSITTYLEVVFLFIHYPLIHMTAWLAAAVEIFVCAYLKQCNSVSVRI